MKIQIRRGVFETNSSSTHSITICPKKEYQRWVDGELLYDSYSEELVPVNIEKEDEGDEDDCRCLTYEEYEDEEYLEGYYTEYTTKSGEVIVVFGKFGRDG